MLERNEVTVGVDADDLGNTIVVDVPDPRSHVVDDRRRDHEVLGSGRAVEDVDVAGLDVGGGGHDDHVGYITKVDLAVVVVVGEVGDHWRDQARALRVVHPLPLDVRLEAVGGSFALALADRVHVVDDLAHVDGRAVTDVDVLSDVELGVAVAITIAVPVPVAVPVTITVAVPVAIAIAVAARAFVAVAAARVTVAAGDDREAQAQPQYGPDTRSRSHLDPPCRVSHTAAGIVDMT